MMETETLIAAMFLVGSVLFTIASAMWLLTKL
jgi:hypothetical protein